MSDDPYQATRDRLKRFLERPDANIYNIRCYGAVTEDEVIKFSKGLPTGLDSYVERGVRVYLEYVEATGRLI